MGAQSNQVRIIAGRWRGRKLQFPDVDGLRPTSDRIRETLFNWLAPVISGAQCLDLFAGSGALGFEAASRGAAEVVMVDRDRTVARTLKQGAELLAADNIDVLCDSAEHFIAGNRRQFDIVFLDPPFADVAALEQALNGIDHGALLKAGGYLYLETPKDRVAPKLPGSLEIHRSKQAGQVAYQLLRYYPDHQQP